MERFCRIPNVMIYSKLTMIYSFPRKIGKIDSKKGISSVNMRKLRMNAGDKVTTDAGEVALASVNNTKYRIPLDHPVLNDHCVFYPKALPHHLLFELTFAPVTDIVFFSDVTKAPNYTITNLELEYQAISSDRLAEQAKASYQ